MNSTIECINPGMSAGMSNVDEEQLGFNECVADRKEDETRNEFDDTPTDETGSPPSRDLESGIDMLLLRHRK